MAKGSLKDISSAIDDAIDGDDGETEAAVRSRPSQYGGSTPDSIDDHDDMRGDNTFGTNATPSTASQGLQTPMVRAILDHFNNGRATPDDLDTITEMVSRGKNGTTGRGGPLPNSDSKYMDDDGSSGRGDGRIPDYH